MSNMFGRHHLVHKDQLVKVIDPTHKWLNDSEFDRILEITGGDLRRATTKALLGVQSRAFIAKDAVVLRDVANKIFMHEAGQLYSNFAAQEAQEAQEQEEKEEKEGKS